MLVIITCSLWQR